MGAHTSQVFAPLDRDHVLERIAGGNETEVYRTDDFRYVVKLKREIGGDLAAVLTEAQQIRADAEEFAACLGDAHTVPNFYVISRDDDGRAQVLVLQPFLHAAHPLANVDYRRLSAVERQALATTLRTIIRRALAYYRVKGRMPDLYGRSSTSHAERKALNAPHMLPWRIWSFLVKRSLLQSHNLLLLHAPVQRVVLIDYDAVRRSHWYRRVYYAVRWLLFWRDWVLIWAMERGGMQH